jgi:molybdopterin-containing oxidoreductase family iron-sulfur binding subunit
MSNLRRIDLAAIRERQKNLSGKEYWRSLEELAGTQEFEEYLHREFPEQASEWFDPVSRRNFLKLMGASLALAGITSCTRQPEEKIVPYVRQPEELISGQPLFFATAMTMGGYANGLLVENHMGRPTKAEGNPDHPASLGATNVFGQACILDLYDPDRAQSITKGGNISSWTEFFQELNLRMQIEKQRPQPGAGLRILTETITSPTLADQIQQLLTAMPAAKWYQYQAVNRDNAYEGAMAAFGEPVETHYRFDQADVIVSLGSDFLTSLPGHVRYIRDFTSRRKVYADSGKQMNRLYVMESTLSITGAAADHRISVRSSRISEFAKAIASALGLGGSSAESNHPFVAEVMKDLQAHRGSGIVIAGEDQPPAVHALAHAINSVLGNVGKTVIHTDPVQARPENQMESLRSLVKEMNSGIVDTLIIMGGNPVFTAPTDFNLRDAMSKVSLRIYLGLHYDETSNLCHWHVPETHFLESWSDARAYDGTTSIIQPLIAPLYPGCKPAHELLAAMTGVPDRKAYDLVRAYWMTKGPAGAAFEKFWQKSLHDGVVAGTALPEKSITARTAFIAELPEASSPKDMEIVFRPDPSIFDGRYANNGWLQELPKPLIKITWDSVALCSPDTAEKLDLNNEEVIELKCNQRSVKAPVWILPGHANDSVTVFFGYGRRRAGRVGSNIGFNAYTIRTSNTSWYGDGLTIQKTGERFPLACTQDHFLMEGRNLVRSASLVEFQKNPEFAKDHHAENQLSMYPEYKYEGHAWGMAIDLGSCIGCNACVVACVAENNIPVVGKDQVKRGREMHWLRIDRYFEGDLSEPKVHHQPVLCMHCEKAPCEVVCPVNATVHSSEGLNDMVYNRCVGTRYCSNNCPYKVRRFNFFLYSDLKTPSLKMARNPDVTVRTRGVMEKCTYCVQRINYARIEAKKEDRRVKDGEAVTACQQACPSQAIVFGDINDPNSAVAKLKAKKLNYALLGELNTVPRTTYLGSIRNPNPALEKNHKDTETQS